MAPRSPQANLRHETLLRDKYTKGRKWSWKVLVFFFIYLMELSHLSQARPHQRGKRKKRDIDKEEWLYGQVRVLRISGTYFPPLQGSLYITICFTLSISEFQVKQWTVIHHFLGTVRVSSELPQICSKLQITIPNTILMYVNFKSNHAADFLIRSLLILL